MNDRSAEYHSRLDSDPKTTGFAILLACLLTYLGTLLLFPPSRRSESIEEAVLRFGYPGPTRYSREIRVRLTQEGPSPSPPNRILGGIRRVPNVPQGAEGTPAPPRSRRARSRQVPDLSGLSRDGTTGSLLRHRFDLPTVQSEELVIVNLVKPEYPLQAIERSLEGHVELLALVNEQGSVDDVEVIQSAGALLDQAAAAAVRRCRFLPYRIGGRVQAVYADFKFNFALVDR
jgi:TonB family protein